MHEPGHKLVLEMRPLVVFFHVTAHQLFSSFETA